MSDLIFDIKEFALHDGSGLRTTVFLKGCPLRCEWCHNPEGQEYGRELSKNDGKCVRCGLCGHPCSHPECQDFRYCIKVCPSNCLKVVGTEYTPEALASELLKNERFLRKGGVTFSGGEPLTHADFIVETVKHLPGINVAVETCGFAPTEELLRATDVISSIYFDIKLINDNDHIKYTGVSNSLILKNFIALMDRGRAVTVRIPLIPTVTDTNENLSGIAAFLYPYRNSVRVELIPYNAMTGAKYASVGKTYSPSFDEKAPLNKNTSVFTEKGIECIAY